MSNNNISYEEQLTSLVPEFYWFRDFHAIHNGRLSIKGSVICSKPIHSTEVVAQVNGVPAKLTVLPDSDYADDKFWFLPKTNRFGVIIEAPLVEGVQTATVSLFPRTSPIEHTYKHIFHQYFDLAYAGVVPPTDRIERVSGKGATPYNYFNNGVTDYFRFSSIARLHGIEVLDSGVRILDWGSGCARLTRHFLNLPNGKERVVGGDIDPDNTAWSVENIDAHAFKVFNLLPPTPFDSDSFDLVLANSVLSHLKIDVMDSWLSEVSRLLKPNGLALLSYHGDFSLAGFCSKTPSFVEKVLQTGFNSDQKASEIDSFISDPQYYRQTFMTDNKAREIFEKHFVVENQITGVVSRFQNVAVLRRRST